MKPRCTGAQTPGHFTSFECVLDEGHDGFCEPYKAPDVDEWRLVQFLLTSAEEDARFYAGRTARIEEACRADVARLQSELDALRAIIESANYACAHALVKLPTPHGAALAEMRGMLDDEPGKDAP